MAQYQEIERMESDPFNTGLGGEYTATEASLRFKDLIKSNPLKMCGDKDVHSPQHYMTFPDMEAIEIISKVLTEKEFVGFMKGNYLKYKLRAGDKKDAMQDISKAKWYQGELKAFVESLNV